MRRLFLTIAAAAALASPTAAVAKDHGNQDHPHGGGQRGGERGGGEHAAPPGWSRGGGRGERAPAAPPAQAPPPQAYGPPANVHATRPQGVRRGGYLPPEMRGGVVGDYGRYRLRPPPPGYAWVRSGRALMLVDMGTGQVFDVIPD